MAAACRRAMMLSRYNSRTVESLASGLRAGSSVARGSSPCMEAQGISSKQAEAITSAITEVLNDNIQNAAQSFLLQGKVQMERHFSTLQREVDKLKSDIKWSHTELSYKIDQAAARQRLDLYLEIQRARDELAKLDNEVYALSAQLEVAKYDVIKYCFGSLASLTVLGFVVASIML